MDDNTGSLAFAGNDALLYGLYSSGYNSTTAWRHLNTLHGFPSDGIGEDPNLSDCNPAMIRFLDRCVEIGDQYNWGSWGVNFYNGLKSKALTPSIDKTLQNLNLTFDERAAEFIAENYLPFTVVDSGSFSRLFPDGSATTRQKVTEAARAFAARSMGAALAGKLRNVCHLSLDIGTIWERYVGVCIHFPNSPPLVFRLVGDHAIVTGTYDLPSNIFDSPLASPPPRRPTVVDDDNDCTEIPLYAVDEPEHEQVHVIQDVPAEDEPNRLDQDDEATPRRRHEKPKNREPVVLSGEAIRKFLVPHLDWLESVGIVALSIITDNGSNVIKVADLEYKGGSIFAIRCACHCIQHIVEQMMSDEKIWGRNGGC